MIVSPEFRSHSETMHNSYIIGTSGDTTTRILEKHDVDILFRHKDSVKHIYVIVIVGPEHQAHTAKEEFLYIMQELRISRMHAKRFGFRGNVIDIVKYYFNVVVCFPLDMKSNKIIITAMKKGVNYAIISHTSHPSSLKAFPFAGGYFHRGCPRVRIEHVQKQNGRFKLLNIDIN